jgi:hypothetical protein
MGMTCWSLIVLKQVGESTADLGLTSGSLQIEHNCEAGLFPLIRIIFLTLWVS